MTPDSYGPTRDDHFSFGIGTVGWEGTDVFGGPVRAPMAADRAVRQSPDETGLVVTTATTASGSASASTARTGR